MTLIAGGALVIGVGAGAGVAYMVIEPRIATLEASVDDAATQVHNLQDLNEDLIEESNGMAEREADLTRREGALSKNTRDAEAAHDDAQQALADRESEIEEREQAVSATEERVAQESFAGGVHVVGRDIAAGQYRTDGGELCYYAWKSGTDGNASIIDNNISEGPATVTVNDGDVFESKGCGTWQKIG